MSDGQPLLRIVSGDPSPEELAALVAVLTSRGGSVDPPAVQPVLWSAPALRQPLSPGVGAWRASSLPR